MEAGFDKPKKETEHDLNREFVMARRENKQSRQDEDERSSTQGGSYLENLIREDVMAGRFQRPICTRFPPEPKGTFISAVPMPFTSITPQLKHSMVPFI